MTSDEFRRIALGFPDCVEASHHHHTDFRVNGKIFATLGYPDGAWAMVRLTPTQQTRYVAAHPDCFRPVNGAWGRRGATSINLFALTEPLARRSLALAHRNIRVAQPPIPQQPEERPAGRASRKRAS
jgi:hypothetical protein